MFIQIAIKNKSQNCVMQYTQQMNNGKTNFYQQ